MKPRRRRSRRCVYLINLTYRCNQQCEFCNRHLDFKTYDPAVYDVTMDQVEEFCIKLTDKPITKLKISGGEPSLHPQFREMVERIGAFGIAKNALVRLNTNARRRIAPIKGIQVMRRRNKIHQPHLVSPLDYGVMSHQVGPKHLCDIATRCGRGFEAKGWTFCALAGPMAELLNKDVWHKDPYEIPDMGVCRHCIWGCNWRMRFIFGISVYMGIIPYPSPFWAQAMGVEAKRRVDVFKAVELAQYYYRYTEQIRKRRERALQCRSTSST